jgi:hypothetical protein
MYNVEHEKKTFTNLLSQVKKMGPNIINKMIELMDSYSENEAFYT